MILEDKDIREILLGGEETVSPQVWAGVARGLDKAAAASRRRVVVLWSSLVALAAAAAVAAVVVFTPAGKPQQGPSSPVVATVENTPKAEDAPAAVDVPEEIEAVEAPEIQDIAIQVARNRAAGSAVARAEEPASSHSAVNPESAPEAPEAGVSAQDSPREPETPVVAEPASDAPVSTSPATSAPTSSSTASSSQPSSAPTVGSMDPFALLMAEENRIGNKPTAITFGGLAQANKVSQPSYGGSGRLGAPAAPITGVKETGSNRFELPVSFGVGLRFPLVAGLSIGAGVNYTRLARSFTGNYAEYDENDILRCYISDVTISETQHYIGLPVNLYYDFVNSGRFSASAFAGATVERCLGIKYRIPDSGTTRYYSRDPQGLQPSVAAGVSLQYSILPKFALYAEPGIRYYFDANQATSIRTMQPWMINLELGLRYNLGK